jgi:hypothetical protein
VTRLPSSGRRPLRLTTAPPKEVRPAALWCPAGLRLVLRPHLVLSRWPPSASAVLDPPSGQLLHQRPHPPPPAPDPATGDEHLP